VKHVQTEATEPITLATTEILMMRIGAACIEITPPLGLPMVGHVRRRGGASFYGRFPLEANILVFVSGEKRIVLSNSDTLGISQPEVDNLRDAVAQATGAQPEAVLLNWSHTHSAPPACPLARRYMRASPTAPSATFPSPALIPKADKNLSTRIAAMVGPRRFRHPANGYWSSAACA
jgi:hypothetical protein